MSDNQIKDFIKELRHQAKHLTAEEIAEQIKLNSWNISELETIHNAVKEKIVSTVN